MKKYLIAGSALLVCNGAAYYYMMPSQTLITRILPAPEIDAQSVVTVSLKALKSQSRLVPLEASYVAVVTSEESRIGGMFHSKKTTIMPGQVRYEIDLSKLSAQWDNQSHSLRVSLPPVEVSEPSVDMTKVTSYSEGMLTSFSGVNDDLDKRNRDIGLQQLRQQAANGSVVSRAKEAATKAVEQMLGMPLRAAGVSAKIIFDS